MRKSELRKKAEGCLEDMTTSSSKVSSAQQDKLNL